VCFIRKGDVFVALLIVIIKGFSTGQCTGSDILTARIDDATITGLKPETSYEVKLLAVNGKGEGESSVAEFFKTKPVRKFTAYSSS